MGLRLARKLLSSCLKGMCGGPAVRLRELHDESTFEELGGLGRVGHGGGAAGMRLG